MEKCILFSHVVNSEYFIYMQSEMRCDLTGKM